MFCVHYWNTLNLHHRNVFCRKHVRPAWILVLISDAYDLIGRFWDMFPEKQFSQFAVESNIYKQLIVGHNKEKICYDNYTTRITISLQPIQPCSNGNSDPPFLLILVKSAAEHIASRDVIRRTWGTNYNVVFIIGSPSSSSLHQHLYLEHKVNDDLILVSTKETYRNNVKKVKIGLYWACVNCQHTKYTVLVDDDVIIFPSRIISYLSKRNYLENIPLYLGHVQSNVPHRSYLSKWFMSYEEYPYDKYPDYVTGGCIIMSRSFIQLASFVTPYINDLYIDDVYLGLVSHTLGVIPTNIKYIGLQKLTPRDARFDMILSASGFHCTDELQDVWNAFTHFNTTI